MLDSLNEIDPVAFYTSFNALSSFKILTISPVNIGETSSLNLQSPLDLNNEPGPYSAMLSDHLFEGDLPENKSSESNILAASESLIVGSLTQMRGGILNYEHKGVGKDSEEKREKQIKKPSKGKGKSKASGPSPMGNKDDHGESKQSIVNNLHLQKVLRGRVFNPDIITKHGMNSLYDLVREFYYNNEFEEDGGINTNIGDKRLHLTEDLL
ncbi:hypothetical protein H5410_047272, partial [Solanum commersonii]